MKNKSGRLSKNNSLLALTIRKIKENSKIELNSSKNTLNNFYSKKDKNNSYTYTTLTTNTKNNSNKKTLNSNNKSVYSLIKKNNFLKTITQLNIVNLKNKKFNIMKNKTYDENEKTNINNNLNFNKQFHNYIYKKKNNKYNKSVNIENNLSNKSINNICDTINTVNKSSLLKEQVNTLRSKNKDMKNKLIIFLKLMRQYSIKLNTLLNNKNDINKNENKDDIINTLTRLNNMLNNPKLNKDVFEITQILLEDSYKNSIEHNMKNKNINNLILKEENNKENFEENNNDTNIIFTEINELNKENYNKNENGINSDENNINEQNNKGINITKNIQKENILHYNNEIQGLISKYEEKIDILMNENNILKEKNEKQKIIHDNLLSENIILEKEINNLKQKIIEENDKYKELFSNYNYILKILLDFENKNNILEQENYFLKKSLNEYSNNSKYTKMNSNNFNQKIKMFKSIEKILKESNDNSYDNKNIDKLKLNKSETQIFPNNIMSYKDLKKDCNYFRKRNISNIGTLRTEPNKFEKIKNINRVSSIKYLNDNNKERDCEEQYEYKKRLNSYNSFDFDYFKKEKDLKNFHKNYSSNMILPTTFNKFYQNQNLKKEIDVLDEEILQIQSKIKEMLNN